VHCRQDNNQIAKNLIIFISIKNEFKFPPPNMQYEAFTEKLTRQISAMPYERQTAFILKICKALFFDYQQFYETEKWGYPDALLDAVNFFEKSTERTVAQQDLETYLSNIITATPDEDHNKSELSACAINACSAIRDALLFLTNKKPSHVINIATYYCDTAFLLIDEPKILTTEAIDNHPLVVETRNFLLMETA
jgi:hypothetical protein